MGEIARQIDEQEIALYKPTVENYSYLCIIESVAEKDRGDSRSGTVQAIAMHFDSADSFGKITGRIDAVPALRKIRAQKTIDSGYQKIAVPERGFQQSVLI